MKIVQFKDGSYAIRRYSLFSFTWKYMDLRSRVFWTKKSSVFFRDCITMDFDFVKEAYLKELVGAYDRRFDFGKGVPIKDFKDTEETV